MTDTTHIGMLGLSVRTYNILAKFGFTRIEHLESQSDYNLLCIPGFGRKMLQELRDAIKTYRSVPLEQVIKSLTE